MENSTQADRKRRIAKALQQARRNKQITQNEMAQKIGKKPSTIGSYEQGVNSVPSDVVLAYCEICGIDSNYLLGIEKEDAKEDAELQILLKKMTTEQKMVLLEFLQYFIK